MGAASATYAADRVYLARSGSVPVATLVVEMQRSVDDEKRWTWPFYLASAHQRVRADTWLVVVALEARVAEWARAPIASFHGGALTPLVIGPADVPRALAGASVELAVLSTMAHGHGEEGGRIAATALLAIRDAAHRDEARVRLYNDVVMASIDAIARVALEAAMKTEGWVWQSEMARHWVGVGVEKAVKRAVRRGVKKASDTPSGPSARPSASTGPKRAPRRSRGPASRSSMRCSPRSHASAPSPTSTDARASD